MDGNKRIPADIFEEMAGVETAPTNVSADNKDSVNIPQEATRINLKRLSAATNALTKFVIKDFNKEFLSIAKELLKLQKSQEIVRQPQSITVEIERTLGTKEEEEEEDIYDKLTNKFPSPYKYIFKGLKYLWKFGKILFKWGLKLLNMLWKAGKSVLQMAKNALSAILKAAGRMFKTMINFLKPLIKRFLKIAIKNLIKTFKFIMRMILKLVRVIWRIVKQLFFRGKNPGKVLFKNEPGPFNFSATVFKIKDGITVKFKALNKRTAFIMRLLRKALRPIQKLFWTVIKKLFGKLLKKLVQTVVSVIVTFVMGQILGSCIPLIGNAIGAVVRSC